MPCEDDSNGIPVFILLLTDSADVRFIEMAPPDAILGLNVAFRNDTNPSKINLGVGVYKDETGNTPVLACVKKAEQLLLEQENSKSYLGIDGLPEYGPLVRKVLFDGTVEEARAVTLQTRRHGSITSCW